jgi:hypothetical protein
MQEEMKYPNRNMWLLTETVIIANKKYFGRSLNKLEFGGQLTMKDVSLKQK